MALMATLCLFILCFGMQVPNISQPNPPKPRPRAVLETSTKSAQEDAHRVTIQVCHVGAILLLDPPVPSRTVRTLGHQRAQDLAPPCHLAPRAPPKAFA
ncbi:MAG TPA: hypothetical protein VI389_09180 [Geobacteraceae bacterium]